MNWQKISVERLKEYEVRKKSLTLLTEQISVLEIKYESIRAASTDAIPVKSGGGNKREDALINNIVSREELKHMIVYQAKNLHTISRINLTNATNVTNAFIGATALQNITFEGTIPISVSFKDCTLLTHDSLMSIINALKDYSEDESGTIYTLTLGTTNQEKLTDEEMAMVTQKGWSLA